MTLARAAFDRAVRRLDGSAARGFVSDLLEARGYRTTVDGHVVVATDDADDPDGSIRLLVISGWRSLTDVRHPVDAVLVTGGPVAGGVGRLALRVGSSRGDRLTLLDGSTLHEWFAYAVPAATRSALADRYLDATEPTAIGRATDVLDEALGGAAARADPATAVSGRAMVVVLVVLVALAAVTAAGPAGLLASTGSPATDGAVTPTPRLTAVPATATPGPTPTAVGRSLPDVCPPAPSGAHPATLRPGVIRTASADGLDGWELLATQNISEFEFDPNDQLRGSVPEVRHVAVFDNSGGAQFRLGLDRWGSPARAETAIADGGVWNIGLSWGAYGLWVEWLPGDAVSGANARRLLAAVRTPGGVKLGGACVSALLTGGTNATA